MATRQIPEAVYEHDIAKLSEAYQKAVRDILKELERIDIDGLSRENASASLADITDRLKELNAEAADWVEKNIPVAAKDGAANAVMALAGIATLDEARKIAKFNQANRRMVEAMIADTQQDLLAVTQNVDRRVRNKVREVSGEVMRRNMAQGINGHRTNKREIVRDLRKELGSVLDTGIIDAGGRRWKPHVYVDMLVRTKMMRAHMEGTINEALERGVMYATISSHGATDACRQYEGKIVKIVSGAPGNYPELDQLRKSNQIFHPNCKHIIVPLRDPSRIDADAPKDINKSIDDGAKKVDNKPKMIRDNTDLPTGEKNRLTDIHTYPDGMQIHIPSHMDWTKQTFSQEQIRKSFEELPEKLREGVKVIRILDGKNEYDAYWEKKYNIPDFRSYATGGRGEINFFANDIFGQESNDADLFPTMAHEAAHVLDHSMRTGDSLDEWFSDGARWKNAKDTDQKTGSSEWTSHYARQSQAIHEDFADGMATHVTDPIGFKIKYPNRAQILEEILGGK